jgi:beta-glucosidase
MKPDTTLPAVARSDFSAEFLWGCSTSSYQIEGAVNEDERGVSIWDRFCEQPGTIRDGSSGAVACDHYHRWPEDLALAQSLGVNAYRFSIAWPRIQADGLCQPNPKGLDFYKRLVDSLLERGIQPWATLYHWDLPQALQERGGWAQRSTVSAFADYADHVSYALGDRVKHWITHNEPWCTAFLGHHHGSHAPGVKDWKTSVQVVHNLLLSHGQAVPVIRANSAGAKVGITLSLHPIEAASSSAEDAAAVVRHDGMRNRWFLDPLHGRGYPEDIVKLLGDNAPQIERGDLKAMAERCDFLGINYYFPEVVAHAPGQGDIATQVVEREGVARTAFGWEISPQGLGTLLQRVQKDYAPPPIYITENGSTFDDVVQADGRVLDLERRAYLAQHIAATRDVIAAGVPVQGYFAWSLLDNFEWAEGYTRRFGLAHVNYETQARTLKASGQWYRQFLEGRFER